MGAINIFKTVTMSAFLIISTMSFTELRKKFDLAHSNVYVVNRTKGYVLKVPSESKSVVPPGSKTRIDGHVPRNPWPAKRWSGDFEIKFLTKLKKPIKRKIRNRRPRSQFKRGDWKPYETIIQTHESTPLPKRIRLQAKSIPRAFKNTAMVYVSQNPFSDLVVDIERGDSGVSVDVGEFVETLSKSEILWKPPGKWSGAPVRGDLGLNIKLAADYIIVLRELSEEEKKEREAYHKAARDEIKKCKKTVSVPHKTMDVQEDLKKIESKWDGRVSVQNDTEMTIEVDLYKQEDKELFKISPSGYGKGFVGEEKTFVVNDPKQGLVKYIVLTMQNEEEPWEKSNNVLIRVFGVSEEEKKPPLMTHVLTFPSGDFGEKFVVEVFFDDGDGKKGFQKLDVKVKPL